LAFHSTTKIKFYHGNILFFNKGMGRVRGRYVLSSLIVAKLKVIFSEKLRNVVIESSRRMKFPLAFSI
jgi:hypothetical protein